MDASLLGHLHPPLGIPCNKPKHPGVGEVRYPDLRRSGMDSTGDAIGYTFATASVESFGSTANELIFFTKLNWQKKLV